MLKCPNIQLTIIKIADTNLFSPIEPPERISVHRCYSHLLLNVICSVKSISKIKIKKISVFYNYIQLPMAVEAVAGAMTKLVRINPTMRRRAAKTNGTDVDDDDDEMAMTAPSPPPPAVNAM